MKSLMTVTSALLLSLCLAVVAVLVLPGVSNQKASANGHCQQGSLEVCFYQNINYGPTEYIYPGIGLYQCTAVTVGNNQASSIKAFAGDGAVSILYYDSSNCTGQYITSGATGPGPNGAGWSWIGSAWNDRISSYMLVDY